MTTPKKDGNVYIWFFTAIIGLLGVFMAQVWGYNSNVTEFMIQNERDHMQIIRTFENDTSWTRWVHRHQIIPAYELSYKNEKELAEIKNTLQSIDSNLVINNNHFKRVFLFLRENRIDGKTKFTE